LALSLLFSAVPATLANDLDLPDISLVAAATEASAPSPKVGDVHEFVGAVATIPCSRWEVVPSDDPAVVVSACEKYRMYFKADDHMNLHHVVMPDGSEAVRFEPAYPALEFPLAVGRQWQREYKGHSTIEDIAWDGDVSCEVADFAPVEVTAGRFDAFRIECKDRWKVADAASSVTSTTWYSPEVGGVVKSVNYEDSRWNTELKAWSR
jgi:hypothetical protein